MKKVTLKYLSLLESRLTEKRLYHSLCVKQEAIKLAEKYDADVEKCAIAGILHDVCKDMPFDEMEKMVRSSTRAVCEIELKEKKLWHSIAGAYFAETELDIDDEVILQAIRYHTVGRKNMSLVEKVIFMADYISEDRKFDYVSRLRLLAYTDLDKACLEAITISLNELINEKRLVPLSTFECYNQLIDTINK